MKKWKKYGAFMFAMVMCLSLAACGSSDSIAASSEETENVEGDSEELVTDAASLDGMWSINGGTKLYFSMGHILTVGADIISIVPITGSADAVKCRSSRKMASR